MNYSQLRRRCESKLRKFTDMPEFAKAFIQDRLDRAEYFRQPRGVWTTAAKAKGYEIAFGHLVVVADLLHAYELGGRPYQGN